MELRRIDLTLLKSLYLVETGVVLSQVLGFKSLTSMLFLLTFPLTIVLWAGSVRKTITSGDILVLCTVALAFIGVLINAVLTNTALSFSYIKKVIIFSMSVLFLQTAYRVRANQEIICFVGRMTDFLSLFLIAVFLLQPGQMYMINGRLSTYLTFRFSNPNLTAMFLLSLYMLKFYRLFMPNKWYRKLGHILIAVFLAFFVVLTQSRNSLAVLVLFTAASIWLVFKGENNLHISKGWALIISLFPALFLMGYMTLIDKQWVQSLFGFLVDEGKELDSRIDIWRRALEHLHHSPLFGAYSQISGGTGSSQMHNTHLDIAASYGVPVLILVCALLSKYLYQRGSYYSDKASFIYILAFACSVILGMGEAALFSGGLGIYIFVGTLLLLVNSEESERINW